MTQVARQDDEAAALVRLGFDELHGFARSVGTMERDIAARAFRYVPMGKPIQFVHDAMSDGVVGALGGATSALGRGAGAVVARRPRPQRPLSATVPGGLGREPYGARLARELGCTPVYIRDNSGRHISENGRSLADLLEAVVAAWPVEVAEVALVGHSMGGLVSRSACHLAAKDGSATVTRSPRHPVGRVVGDTLVLKPSASGRSRTRKLGFEDEYGLHLAATNHIALLNHPGVYEKLWEWLR